MSRHRQAQGTRHASIEEYTRLACSTDPSQPPRRPMRVALAARCAVIAGVILVCVGIAMAVTTLWHRPDAAQRIEASATASAIIRSLRPADPLDYPSASPTSLVLMVHVAGAVNSPGVVTLTQGARVVDALNAAGGGSQDADLDQLNLARVLSDGERIRVPHIGEELEDQQGADDLSAAHANAGRAGGAEEQVETQGGKININTADATALEQLPGIGPALAQRIIDYRSEHGPFESIDSLTQVPGIGPTKMESLRQQATV